MTNHTELVALALLSRGPRHGYELLKDIETMRIDAWAKVPSASLYRTLSRLESDGLLSRTVDREGPRPARNVYALTSAGRERLDELILAALDSPQPAYSDRVVGGVFSGLLDPPAQRDAVGAARRRLEEAERRLAGLSEAEPELSREGLLVSEYQRACIRAEIELLRGMTDREANDR